MKTIRNVAVATMAMALIVATVLINIRFPDFKIRLADVLNLSTASLVVVMVLVLATKAISFAKAKFKAWCDESDRGTMRAMLAFKMAAEYGIDINDKDAIKRGDPIKLLMNDVNWMDQFDKYKYTWGVPRSEKSNTNEIDIYDLQQRKGDLCVA